MIPGGEDLGKSVSTMGIMIKCVCWQLGICFRQHHLFINNPSVRVLLLMHWVLTATMALSYVLGNFLSLLLCPMAILFQNEHKRFAVKTEIK